MKPADMRLLRSYLREREKDVNPYLFISNRMLPMHRHTLWDAMRVYGERAELPPQKRTFKVWQHSIAVHLLDADADISFVQDWLGHTNIDSAGELTVAEF